MTGLLRSYGRGLSNIGNGDNKHQKLDIMYKKFQCLFWLEYIESVSRASTIEKTSPSPFRYVLRNVK
jgi:hypothetical protein